MVFGSILSTSENDRLPVREAVAEALGLLGDPRPCPLGRGSVSIFKLRRREDFPEEVEAALKSHPAVFDALVSVPDERWGSRVTAVVQPRAGQRPTLAELTEHCRSHIAAYKIPRELHLVEQIRRSPERQARLSVGAGDRPQRPLSGVTGQHPSLPPSSLKPEMSATRWTSSGSDVVGTRIISSVPRSASMRAASRSAAGVSVLTVCAGLWRRVSQETQVAGQRRVQLRARLGSEREPEAHHQSWRSSPSIRQAFPCHIVRERDLLRRRAEAEAADAVGPARGTADGIGRQGPGQQLGPAGLQRERLDRPQRAFDHVLARPHAAHGRDLLPCASCGGYRKGRRAARSRTTYSPSTALNLQHALAFQFGQLGTE